MTTSPPLPPDSGTPLITGPLYLVLGNGLPARGVLARSALLGAPVLIDIFMAIAVVPLAFFWRGIRNDGREGERHADHARGGATRAGG